MATFLGVVLFKAGFFATFLARLTVALLAAFLAAAALPPFFAAAFLAAAFFGAAFLGAAFFTALGAAFFTPALRGPPADFFAPPPAARLDAWPAFFAGFF